jgi:hypothetical protein
MRDNNLTTLEQQRGALIGVEAHPKRTEFRGFRPPTRSTSPTNALTEPTARPVVMGSIPLYSHPAPSPPALSVHWIHPTDAGANSSSPPPTSTSTTAAPSSAHIQIRPGMRLALSGDLPKGTDNAAHHLSPRAAQGDGRGDARAQAVLEIDRVISHADGRETVTDPYRDICALSCTGVKLLRSGGSPGNT